MRKLIITTVALAVTLAAGTAEAGILGWRNRGAVVAPAPVTTARVENGYRSFSYQPAPVYVAPTYGVQNRQLATRQGFHDAGWKIRGF